MEKCTNCKMSSVIKQENIKICKNCGQIEIQSSNDFDAALLSLKSLLPNIDSAYIILEDKVKDIFIEMFPASSGMYNVNIRKISNNDICLSEKILNEQQAKSAFENFMNGQYIYYNCNSCGGELEKDGNVYVCKQCGEVFKNEYMAEQGNIEVHKESVFPTSSTSANMPQTQKSGGCYVATCVYGSYNCPQVWTLRRYRDNTLAKTWHGRAFIHTYYAISPTIVKWFGNTTWFKKLWRGKLDKMVRNLNNDGVSNAPYEDRSW